MHLRAQPKSTGPVGLNSFPTLDFVDRLGFAPWPSTSAGCTGWVGLPDVPRCAVQCALPVRRGRFACLGLGQPQVGRSSAPTVSVSNIFKKKKKNPISRLAAGSRDDQDGQPRDRGPARICWRTLCRGALSSCAPPCAAVRSLVRRGAMARTRFLKSRFADGLEFDPSLGVPGDSRGRVPQAATVSVRFCSFDCQGTLHGDRAWRSAGRRGPQRREPRPARTRSEEGTDEERGSSGGSLHHGRPSCAAGREK